MTAEKWRWILGAAAVLWTAGLSVWTVYLLRQWRRLEQILEDFQAGKTDGADVRDVQETRESRMISQLRQILDNAAFKEKQAVTEKNQVMELISDLSHQLKTPLANIVMNTEILEEGMLDGESRSEFLKRTRQQAAKMQWLMQNLVKASRLENGMIGFQAKNTGIKATIARAVGAVYAQASGKQIEIRVEEFEDIPLYHNPKWTAEALANILENAVKYSPGGSCVSLGLTHLELYTRITISDQGPGIPEEDYSRIFQRFYRGEQADEAEGSGLGLYLAQLILQSEKGYITVSSKEGQGSCFSVFLLNRGEG